MIKTSKEEQRVAMQHHQMTSNSLFTVGRAGLKRIVESKWTGSYTTDDGDKVTYTIEAEGTRTMNASDQDVFLNLLYLHRITDSRKLIKKDKLELKTKGVASMGAHLNLSISGYQLIKMLGWSDGGKSYQRLLNILDRIGRVYLICNYEDNETKQVWSSHLLHHNYSLNKKTNKEKIQISLCPIFALAAHKQGASLHSSHCLWERKSLSNCAKVLHGAICSRLRPGNKQRFKTDKIIEYMYGEMKEDRRIKSKVKTIIKELKDLTGWEINYQQDSQNWLIQRPKITL